MHPVLKKLVESKINISDKKIIFFVQNKLKLKFNLCFISKKINIGENNRLTGLIRTLSAKNKDSMPFYMISFLP